MDILENMNIEKQIQIKTPVKQVISYDIEKITESCLQKECSDFINYLCYIMNERKKYIIEMLYEQLGKKYLIATLESALKIQNSGGQLKVKSGEIAIVNTEAARLCTNQNSKKTTGGIFFSLLQKDNEAREILKKASKIESKLKRERKKLYKSFEKLNFIEEIH